MVSCRRPDQVVPMTATAKDAAVLPKPAPTLSSAPWVVAAMAKNVFLEATATWAERLERAGRAAIDVRADRARRSDLLAAFAAGPDVVLYAGHGRPRGWAGYQALRIVHFDRDGAAGDEVRSGPVGLVLAFACSTLDRSTGRVPFGQLLVDRGIARAYLAPAGPVVTAEAEVLADLVVDLLCRRVSSGEPLHAGGLIVEIDRQVAGRAASAWSTFEFVGDTTTRIV